MRRTTAFCLAFAAAIGCASSIDVCGAGTEIKAGFVSCAAGGEITLPITIENNGGFANLGIEIEYDGDILTLIGAESGVEGAIFTGARSLDINPYNMSWDSTGNVDFNGTIALLSFEVSSSAPPGEYPIRVSCYKGRNGNYIDGADVNYDENFNALNLSYKDGCITVEKNTSAPTATPTAKPTATPTAKPTATPTAKPTVTPTAKPTATPTAKPTATPTAKPTATPTGEAFSLSCGDGYVKVTAAEKGECCLIAATYSEDGLRAVEVIPLSFAGAGSTDVSLSGAAADRSYTTKLLLWNSLEEMRPLHAAYVK